MYLNFYDCYELVGQYYYSNETRNKIFLPKEKIKPQTCIFCGKSTQETTFKKIAHIIPAALGNRTLFTTIECDKCNQKSGDTIENNFTEYLNPMRGFARKPGKKGHVKYKPTSKTSHIISSALTNTVEIMEDEKDYGIKTSYLPDNKMIIDITPTRPINYLYIVKVIAKMGLLLLPEEEIKKNYHLIEWIKGEIDYLPIFTKGFIPGAGLKNTILSIYKLKNNEHPLEPFFISFYFSAKFFFLHLPASDFHIPKYKLRPDLLISPINRNKLISNIMPQIEIIEAKDEALQRKEEFLLEYQEKGESVFLEENEV